ncbi:trypco2 family protein [Roseomonas sp. BN140053]|uniref:trypco2 family protein n=1 Tax=Roseomonas sp. BN140053 TaxID=3391898 RepID=UPI0039E9E178
MDDLAEDLSIETLVRAVSDQLLRSQAAREASGKPAVFEVSEMTLEVSFVVRSSKQAGGGFTLSVIKADGSMKFDKETVQKVSLKLAAAKSQGRFEGFGPVRPRAEVAPAERIGAGGPPGGSPAGTLGGSSGSGDGGTEQAAGTPAGTAGGTG